MKRREALMVLTGGVVLAGAGLKIAAEEKPPVVLCSKCGQIKGSAKCCKEGSKKCGKCGLDADSPGCCRIPEGCKPPLQVCDKCGEIKGSDKCCKEGAKKCGKCGMDADSPGCRIKCPEMAAKTETK